MRPRPVEFQSNMAWKWLENPLIEIFLEIWSFNQKNDWYMEFQSNTMGKPYGWKKMMEIWWTWWFNLPWYGGCLWKITTLIGKSTNPTGHFHSFFLKQTISLPEGTPKSSKMITLWVLKQPDLGILQWNFHMVDLRSLNEDHSYGILRSLCGWVWYFNWIIIEYFYDFGRIIIVVQICKIQWLVVLSPYFTNCSPCSSVASHWLGPTCLLQII